MPVVEKLWAQLHPLLVPGGISSVWIANESLSINWGWEELANRECGETLTRGGTTDLLIKCLREIRGLNILSGL